MSSENNLTSAAVDTLEVLVDDKPFAVWKNEMIAIKEKYKRYESAAEGSEGWRHWATSGGGWKAAFDGLCKDLNEALAFDPLSQ